MDLCVSKFKESEGLYVGPKEAGYCLLRSQLLMAFHDNAAFRHLANEVSSLALLCLQADVQVWRLMLTFTCVCCMAARKAAKVQGMHRNIWRATRSLHSET